MTSQERSKKIEAYGNAYNLLVEALGKFPQTMWDFRPAPDRWTIQEIVVHITDSEVNSFIRARRAIAEPGSTVLDYDESQWAKALHYHEQSAEDAVQLFKWLRGNTYKIIKNLPESVWAQTIEHSVSGTMTLDNWLEIYTNHVPNHIAQMEEVFNDWKASQR